MQQFTKDRVAPGGECPDALWLCQHTAVFTQGIAGKIEHLIDPGEIPIEPSDRGGQVTFHGPGQVVAYPLIDLKRAGYFVKEYVYRTEEALIKTLLHFGATGHRVAGAPGIYVALDHVQGHSVHKHVAGPSGMMAFEGLGKIAAIGIKVHRGCAYHGVALNVNMDLTPYTKINPCGYAGLQTVDFSTIGVDASWDEAASVLAKKLDVYLGP